MPVRGRREAALLLGAPLVSSYQSAVAFEPEGYNVQLPATWQIKVENRLAKARGKKTLAMLLGAGDDGRFLEAKVLRIPLDVALGKDGAQDGEALMGYFSSDGQQGPEQRDKVIDALSKSSARTQSFIGMEIVGKTDERVTKGVKYLRSDFEAVTCTGAKTEGLEGEIQCFQGSQRIKPRRHAVISTIAAGPSKGVKAKAAVLWVLDVSVPPEAWSKSQAEVEQVLNSFAIDTEA